jgi:hypothetical protein
MKRFQIVAYILIVSCILAAAAETASAFEVTEMVFTNEAYDCQKPVSKASFTDNDLGVTAWIYYLDFEDGRTWKLEWYAPNNALANSVSNSRGSTVGGCSYRSISRDTLREYGTGQWTVKFYYDGQLAKSASFSYTMTQANIWQSEKIYAIPDYSQTDPSYGGFPEGGSNYCAPTSVSNSLMWLANNGFDNLAANTADRKKDQYDLILNLGTKYMSTDPSEGTNVREVLTGVRNYLSDKGYKDFQLKYQGWRESVPEAATGVEVPDMGWIKSGIEGMGSVWLNLGWYTYDAGKDEYNRVGGHWVTLVGYGYNGNPDYLVIHDPNTTAYTNHFVLPVRITGGTLTGSNSGLPRSAVGFYKMNNGMKISSKGDFGILDGVIVLSTNLLNYLNIGQLGNDLKLNLSCAQFQGNQYQFALNYSPTPTDPTIWKLDLNSFKPLQNSSVACLALGNDLKLNLNAEYGGIVYSFSMNYAPTPNDPLIWKMDVGTLKAK